MNLVKANYTVLVTLLKVNWVYLTLLKNLLPLLFLLSLITILNSLLLVNITRLLSLVSFLFLFLFLSLFLFLFLPLPFSFYPPFLFLLFGNFHSVWESFRSFTGLLSYCSNSFSQLWVKVKTGILWIYIYPPSLPSFLPLYINYSILHN